MKRRSATTIGLCGLAAGAFISLAVAAEKRENSGKVEIKEDVILIHPGTRISKSDTAALNEVLRKYDKSLYKIETYKNGKLKKKLGELSDMLVDQATASELSSAKEAGGSDRAIQVIALPSAGPQRVTSPIPAGPHVASPSPAGPHVTSPTPAGPHVASPTPAGPHVTHVASPTPAGPHVTSPTPTGPHVSPRAGTAAGPHVLPTPTPGSTTNPQQSPPVGAGENTQLIERLKPILEKYSK